MDKMPTAMMRRPQHGERQEVRGVTVWLARTGVIMGEQKEWGYIPTLGGSEPNCEGFLNNTVEGLNFIPGVERHWKLFSSERT